MSYWIDLRYYYPTFEKFLEATLDAFMEAEYPPCRKPLSRAILHAFLEKTLPPEQREPVRQHWRSCPYCFRRFVKYCRTWKALRHRPEPPPEEGAELEAPSPL